MHNEFGFCFVFFFFRRDFTRRTSSCLFNGMSGCHPDQKVSLHTDQKDHLWEIWLWLSFSFVIQEFKFCCRDSKWSNTTLRPRQNVWAGRLVPYLYRSLLFFHRQEAAGLLQTRDRRWKPWRWRWRQRALHTGEHSALYLGDDGHQRAPLGPHCASKAEGKWDWHHARHSPSLILLPRPASILFRLPAVHHFRCRLGFR